MNLQSLENKQLPEFKALNKMFCNINTEVSNTSLDQGAITEKLQENSNINMHALKIKLKHSIIGLRAEKEMATKNILVRIINH